MEFAEIRTRIRAIIFSITGFIIALIFLRICLDLVSADQTNVLVSLINQITDFLISPFLNLIVLPADGILLSINIDAIVSFIAYLLGAIVLTEVITAFVYDNLKDILQNIIDALFKIIEAFLLLRIVFDLFGVGLNLNSPEFVKVVYSFTQWAQGIIFNQNFGTGMINISTILCLIIVVILDILAERFLDSTLQGISTFARSSSTTVSKVNIGGLLTKVPILKPFKPEPKPQQQMPMQQNIIINVPVPQGSQIPTQVIVDASTNSLSSSKPRQVKNIEG